MIVQVLSSFGTFVRHHTVDKPSLQLLVPLAAGKNKDKTATDWNRDYGNKTTDVKEVKIQTLLANIWVKNMRTLEKKDKIKRKVC